MKHFRYSLRSFLLILLVVTTTGIVRAQSAPAGQEYVSVLDDPRVQVLGGIGLDFLYDMKFEQAASRFDEVELLYPEHPVGPFLKGLITWWNILPDLTNTSYDEAFFDAMDEVIQRSDRLLKKDKQNFDAMFFKGAALGFRGRLRSNRKAWFKAARDGKEAMEYVLEVAEADTTNADFIFGKGVYDYFAATVPQKYPVVKPLMVFFPDGNRELGLQELQRTAEEGHFIRTEAVYFLLQIYFIYEPNYQKSMEYARWLRTEHPDNGFFHAIEGRVYAQWGRWKKAQEIYADVLARSEANQPGYTEALAEQALYFLARSKMIYQQYEEALEDLLRLEALTAGREETFFKTLAHLRIGMVYDAQGQREQAEAYYKKTLKLKDRSEAHKRAKAYLKEPYTG